jgi:hypothetical protein
VNYNKVKGIIQKQEKNPVAFYSRLKENFRKYTILDPESIKGFVLLNHHLSISWSQTLEKSFRS